MINYLEIKGFKSIEDTRLELQPINILIGSNGSGKSNFISFFNLVKAIFNQQLQQFILEEDKAENILFFGRKNTKAVFAKLIFSSEGDGNNAYIFELRPTKSGGLYLGAEASGYNVAVDDNNWNYDYDYNLEESNISKSVRYRDKYLSDYLADIRIFHFHDTSSSSPLRQGCQVEDNRFLKSDGRNLPAFLYQLKYNHPKHYHRILKVVQSIAPYIHDFILEPSLTPGKNEQIELRWNERSNLESNFSAHQFSDGTMRFIALATVLLQPFPPSVILIDEPELGLHPFAISKLAGMIELASAKSQIIISTQSVNFVDCFQPNNIITVDKDIQTGGSIFNRLDDTQLEVWLNEHTIGELWERNIIETAQPLKKY